MKSTRTILLAVLGIVVGYTGATLTGCNHTEEHDHDTVTNAGHIDSVCVDTCKIVGPEVSITVDDSSEFCIN